MHVVVSSLHQRYSNILESVYQGLYVAPVGEGCHQGHYNLPKNEKPISLDEIGLPQKLHLTFHAADPLLDYKSNRIYSICAKLGLQSDFTPARHSLCFRAGFLA